MILVIDNYDSFVFNLARYFNILGFETTIIRNDKIDFNIISLLKPTHIVISPGPCAPDQAGLSLAIIHEFYNKIPILGVCLGHQAIGQAFGAKVIKAKFPTHGKSSVINHNSLGLFANIPNNIKVARYHSLIVDLENTKDLTITATTQENEIMAIAHKNYPVFGVQFHPESILSEYGLEILKNFTIR